MPHLISRADRPDRRDTERRRLGPYETAYDVRRGYDLPPRVREREEVLLFRGHEEREEGRVGEGG